MRKVVGLCLAAAAIAMSPALSAHHGGAAFDQTKNVTFQGTMTELQFANPHVLLFFDVKNDKGETENWSGWLTAPTKLARAGWTKRTLEPGDKVTIEGRPHKAGSKVVQIRKLIGPDGMELALFEE
jgi:uncharacterized protein YdeI (BOF family)